MEPDVVLCQYGGCRTPASYTITASYPADWGTGGEHPHTLHFAYPAPMGQACRNHLAAVMEHDTTKPGATPTYMIRSI